MPANKLERHPEWSKKTIHAEIKAGVSLRSICKKYHIPGVTPSAGSLYNEITRWRYLDPVWDKKLTEILATRDRGGSGRPRKEQLDPSLADWRQKFCTDLFEGRSRLKAAQGSPHSYEYIYKMLNERYPEYDKHFAELVHVTEMRMCASIEDDYVASIDAMPHGFQKAIAADKFLSKRDPSRWSDRIEMRHSGTVQHNHTHKAIGTREERLLELASQQQAFLQTQERQLMVAEEQKALPAETIAIDNVIDAEVLEPVEVFPL